MMQELTDTDFSRTISGSTPILVDFWAAWCGPCRMLAPVLEEVSKEYAGKLRFAKLDTEAFPEIAAEQEITGIPCLIIFQDGKEVDRIIGFSPKLALKQKIDAVLAGM